MDSLTRVKYIESNLLRVAYILHEANPIAIVNIVYTNTITKISKDTHSRYYFNTNTLSNYSDFLL